MGTPGFWLLYTLYHLNRTRGAKNSGTRRGPTSEEAAFLISSAHYQKKNEEIHLGVILGTDSAL